MPLRCSYCGKEKWHNRDKRNKHILRAHGELFPYLDEAD